MKFTSATRRVRLDGDGRMFGGGWESTAQPYQVMKWVTVVDPGYVKFVCVCAGHNTIVSVDAHRGRIVESF